MGIAVELNDKLIDRMRKGGYTVGAQAVRVQKIVRPDVSERFNKNMSSNMQLLYQYAQLWEGLQDFRDRRKRNIDYIVGEHFNESITNPDTRTSITEKAYLESKGIVPLKQNIIRQLVRNMIGQYLQSPAKVTVTALARENAALSEMLTNTIQACRENLKLGAYEPRWLEEFLASGVLVSRSYYKYFDERNIEDGAVVLADNNRIFFDNNTRDIFGQDITVIGEFYDMTRDAVVASFARNKEEGDYILSRIYTGTRNEYLQVNNSSLSGDAAKHEDFLIPENMNMCRVIVAWQKNSRWTVYAHDPLNGSYGVTDYTVAELQAMNRQRIAAGVANGVDDTQINKSLIQFHNHYEQYWSVKYLSPYGNCLFESETPYEHESHPYTIFLYPMINGRVWSMVEDVIDQQRYINRLMMIMDKAMINSAKGVWIFPKDSLEGQNLEDIADDINRGDAVIQLSLKPGAQLPQQLVGKGVQVGAQELLAAQMELIMQISGVNSAIQGQQPGSGTPASRYAMEAQYSSTNSRDLFEAFGHFLNATYEKLLKVLLQFYEEPRYVGISGKSYHAEALYINPELVKNLAWKMNITQGVDTPVYRQMLDDTLFKLMALPQGAMLDLKMFLEASSLPYADRILDMLNKKEQAMQQQPQVDPNTGQPIQGMQGQQQQQQMLSPDVVKQLQQDYGQMQGTPAMQNVQRLRTI